MIVRRRRTKNFTIIENEIFDDERLSMGALAVLAYLRSRPDDWSVSVEQLRSRFKCGINKMHDLVRELVDLGWVTRERKRDAVTKAFIGMEYVVLDEAAPTRSTEVLVNRRGLLRLLGLAPIAAVGQAVGMPSGAQPTLGHLSGTLSALEPMEIGFIRDTMPRVSLRNRTADAARSAPAASGITRRRP